MTSSAHTLPDLQICWQAVAENDTSYDGHFVYAVTSTGIFCQPSCSSRLPKRDHVRFFATSADAQAEGFRACLRCQPTQSGTAQTADNAHHVMVAQVCDLIRQRIERADKAPTLVDLGQLCGYSPTYLQRVFKEMMGISPRQYAIARRRDAFRQQLQTQERVTDAIYASGYGSSSRAYENSGAHLGMPPTDYQQGGAQQRITYAITDSPLGFLLVARTERGICAVLMADNPDEAQAMIEAEFNQADLTRDDAGLGAEVESILAYLGGWQPDFHLPLDLRVTAFQARVLEALQGIPYGETRSYGDIARAIGKPKAARAVGNACNKNPIPIIIPCHRVVHGDGRDSGYAYGVARKRYLLDIEKTYKDES